MKGTTITGCKEHQCIRFAKMPKAKSNVTKLRAKKSLQIAEGSSHQVQLFWYQIMHIEQQKAKLSSI
jgi:hypothetical protein